MKPLALITVSAVALTAAACGPRTPPARASLDCPTTQGDLTRTGVSGDGKACTYVTDDGAEVTLQLVALAGGPDATLQRIETNLLANRTPPEAEEKAEADPKAPKGVVAEVQAQVKSEVQGDVDRAVQEALEDSKGAGVTVQVRKDGKVIAEERGTTRVQLPGIHVVASDDDDSAHVQVGPITVDAGDNKMTFRLRRDVRLKGEALNPQKRGIRATFIYTGEDLPEGYRFVGYEAGGPKTGPITVAVVRSKSEGPSGEELQDDVQKLVRKNGGV